jgi:D-3-phosphoglycerate dehydrogenase
MYRIQTFDRIPAAGLEQFPLSRYEIASGIAGPDAIIVRGSDLRGKELPETLKVVVRVGTECGNVPVDDCTRLGVPVLTTPGAEAVSVKELVIAALLLSSRRIVDGIVWARSLADRDDVTKLVEERAPEFGGPELYGKSLGVVGLGPVGVMVANAAVSLGMRVTGFDPAITVEGAWGLAREVNRAPSLDALLAESDYLTLHLPMDDRTRGLIGRDRIAVMKRGVRLLNFSRGGLVNNEEVIEALRAGKIALYATDFPDVELLHEPNIIAFPRLGPETPEAANAAAIAAARSLREYLEQGTIRHSVNFPDCGMEHSGNPRIVLANRNIPNMVGQITTVLAEARINILDMLNRHRGSLAYNIIDLERPIPAEVLEKLKRIDGVIMAREL